MAFDLGWFDRTEVLLAQIRDDQREAASQARLAASQQLQELEKITRNTDRIADILEGVFKAPPATFKLKWTVGTPQEET